MNKKEIILRCSNLTKKFGGLTAVDNISFDLEKNEILGLIGPNGSGKTTLVNMISGNIKPTCGDVSFKGRQLKGLKPYQIGNLGIARTYQIVKPFPGMTVLENVAVGSMNGKSKKNRSVKDAFISAEEIIKFVGLKKYKNYKADNLSIASRKRLEMAKVLAMDPDIIFFDEVMAGLNHKEIDNATEIICKIREKGISILIIEHVMRAINSISDRIFVLHHGRNISQGPPAEVLNDKRVIRAYLGKRYKQLVK